MLESDQSGGCFTSVLGKILISMQVSFNFFAYVTQDARSHSKIWSRNRANISQAISEWSVLRMELNKLILFGPLTDTLFNGFLQEEHEKFERLQNDQFST